MQKRTVPGGEEFIGGTGSVVITAPVPNVVVLRMKGHVTEDTVPGQMAFMDRIYINSDNYYFYDLWEMESYDGALRIGHTNWHLSHRQSLRALHTITKSKLVKMGVSVANVALGLITQHRTPEAFEVVLKRTVDEQTLAHRR